MPDSSLNLPALLVIMDGYGLSEPGPGNAIEQASTPHLDKLYATMPWVKINASEEPVGLPPGQMGNSEVGHLNIGAGRTVFQEFTRINNACRDGSLEANELLQRAFDSATQKDGVLHLMGLVSDGGVHSFSGHLYALLKMAAARKVPYVHVHCFMDGRDVPPSSGKGYIAELLDEIKKIETPDTKIEIASISGRYYAMDRDNRWQRVEKAWRAIVCGEPYADVSPTGAMQRSYDDGVTDEFVVPVALDTRGIEPQDSVVFFNFRPDRAREITRAIVDRDFDHFDRTRDPNPMFVCMTEYDPTIDAPIAFPKTFPEHVLADVLADAGLAQYHIAETEKYAHVTFFLNGGREEPKKGETRKLIPSPKVATYDLQPEMSEPEVAHTLAQAIRNDEADVYICNFANCDMVGHTGDIPATIKAVEAVDAGIGEVLCELEKKHGVGLITADHGNADRMLEDDGKSPHTAHTTALVPLIMVDYKGLNASLTDDQGGAALCNITPTLLDMIGLEKSAEMVAPSLMVRK